MSCESATWGTRWLCYGSDALMRGAGPYFSPSSEAVEKVASEVLKGLAETIGKGGGSLGEGVGTGTAGFFDAANFEKMGATLGGESNKGFSAILDGLDIASLAERLANNFKDSSDRAGPILEEVGLDTIARGGRLAWEAMKTYLPYTVLGLMVTTATPYGVKYLYEKSVDNLTKPKLASEVKYYTLPSRIYDTATTGISTFFKIAYPTAVATVVSKFALISTPALKSGLTFWMPGITNYIPKSLESFADGIARELGSLNRNNRNPFEYIFPNFKSLTSEVLSFEIGSWGYWKTITAPNIQLVDRISFAVGIIAACGVGYAIYQNYLKRRKEEPKAIFNKELTEKIEDITQATYNIQKNNGFFQNLLLYGPGGTGKTMVAKLIARNSNINYVMMSGGDLAQYIKRKDHVTELNKLISRAQNSSTPTILFIDEAESLARDRDLMQSPEHVELLNAFLNHTGEASKKLMIILATNRIEDIDPAVLSRMDHKLHIAPPESPERKIIIDQYIPKFFSKEEQKTFFTEEKVKEICGKIEGFTGRTIFKMINAMSGKKSATKDNKLTNALIDSVVDSFVRQEKEVVELLLAKKANKIPVVIAEPIVAAELQGSIYKRMEKAVRGFFKAKVALLNVI